MKVGEGELIIGFLRGNRVRIAFVAHYRMLGISCCEDFLADKDRGARSLVGIDDGFEIVRILEGSVQLKDRQPLLVEGFLSDHHSETLHAPRCGFQRCRATHALRTLPCTANTPVIMGDPANLNELPY